MVSSKYFFRLGRLFILSQLYIAGLGVDAQGHETHSHGHKHLSHGRLHKSKTLAARDDYSCSASNPCSNGACCGAGGYCGYGSTYCGDGCLSNCDATAECGQYAATKNATCPLNVCCSEYGFCGTTEDFCSSGCQSNCVLEPSPPDSSSSAGPTSKVIGYYEGWSANSKCHQTSVSDLPLGSLTHLNFAFAYLDPDTYEVVPMESDMSWDLFDDVTAAKDTNSDLKVFVSIGGWSFSDNDADTQPLFGEIAADADNRSQFATNVLKFLNWYGFDGVDIDWEYPGAGDRGGKERDTDNYVKLLKELRSTFDASGRDLGITFTAPSSYWYLKWFDIAGLLKYADWVNLMTYDLHGTWDANNAIGSIVQGHTNLTEIKTAAELLWRVDTDPSQVVLGFGFYGRSFTLSDASCGTPGCSFSGGGDAGVCTDTSGYLAYYEIANILEKDSSITPVHDKDAAVLYFQWNTDQWISYDNATTFKQKLEWAEEVGIGGSLIWASDQDDYSFTAHKALLGSSNVTKAQVLLQKKSTIATQSVLTSAVSDSLNQNCYRGSECVDLGNPLVTCDSGYTLVGYDKSKCRSSASKWGMPICCATTSAPKSCTWRGSGKDCNGQCHSGEIELYTSNTGGGDYLGFKSESGTSKCNRGNKAFCCTDNTFDDLTADCYWTGCSGSCKSDEVSVATAVDLNGWCVTWNGPQHYCCKSDPVPLLNCHWVGKGDCADNTCNDAEVTLATDNQGGSWTGCNWWRKKALCCTANGTPSSTCPQSYDPCDEDPDDCLDPETGENLAKRDYYDWEEEYLDTGLHSLEKRATRPKAMNGVIQTFQSTFQALAWPPAGGLFKGSAGKTVLYKVFDLTGNSCSRVAIAMLDPSDVSSKIKLDTEHPVDKSIISALFRTAVGGILPSGTKIVSKVIDGAKWEKHWATSVSALKSLPSIADGNSLIPNDRLYSVLGSVNYRDVFLKAEKELNMIKGRIFYMKPDGNGLLQNTFAAPQAEKAFNGFLQAAIKTGSGENAFFDPIRRTIGVFSYIHHEEVLSRINTVRQNLYLECQILAEYVDGFQNLPAIYKEFDTDYYNTVTELSKTWVTQQLMSVALGYLGSSASNAAAVQQTIEMLRANLDNIVVPSLETLK